MEMRCGEWGCVADRGGIVKWCADPDCCCKDLPDKQC